MDVEDLKRHTVYSGGYTKDSRSVAMFWEAGAGYKPEAGGGAVRANAVGPGA